MLRGWQVFCRCAESSSHTGPSIASHPSSTAPVFLHSRLRAYPSRPGGGHVPPFALIFNHAITTERPAGVLPTTHTGGHKQNRTTGPSQPASQLSRQYKHRADPVGHRKTPPRLSLSQFRWGLPPTPRLVPTHDHSFAVTKLGLFGWRLSKPSH